MSRKMSFVLSVRPRRLKQRWISGISHDGNITEVGLIYRPPSSESGGGENVAMGFNFFGS
jgi:hypothetical protein